MPPPCAVVYRLENEKARRRDFASRRASSKYVITFGETGAILGERGSRARRNPSVPNRPAVSGTVAANFLSPLANRRAAVYNCATTQFDEGASGNVNDNSGFGISLSGNQMAAGLMLGYVVLMSFVPLLIAFGAGESPFIFNAAWRVGGLAGCALILRIVFPRMLFSGEVWKAVGTRTLSFAMLWWVVGFLDLVLYAWSTQFIDVSVAATLYETWPIFLVILMGWLFRMEARYREITTMTIFLFVVALIGIVSVISSQAGGIGAFVSAARGGGR